MRLRRFGLPIVLVSAIVLLGGITAAFVAAKSEPPPDAMVSPAEAAPAPRFETMPGPASKSLSEAKSVSGITLKESSPPVSQGAEWEGAGQETVYTWQDGDTTRRVVLQTRPADQETVVDTTEGASENRMADKGEMDRIAREGPEYGSRPEHGSDAPPVFRSESGSELMTLPGGIVLALDPEWGRDAVESFFSRNGIALERASELDFLDNGFLVESEPGLPSLELANTLAEQDGVILSSPNWSREMELK